MQTDALVGIGDDVTFGIGETLGLIEISGVGVEISVGAQVFIEQFADNTSSVPIVQFGNVLIRVLCITPFTEPVTGAQAPQSE